MGNPQDLVLHTIRDFDSCSEGEIALREEALRYDLSATAELSLLYALRVAGAGVRAKTLGTLVSRWRDTNCGAGGFGLDKGRASPAYPACANFLTTGFALRFQFLVEQAVNTAREKAAGRKGAEAKRSVYLKAAEKLEHHVSEMSPALPGTEKWLRDALETLRQDAEVVA